MPFCLSVFYCLLYFTITIYNVTQVFFLFRLIFNIYRLLTLLSTSARFGLNYLVWLANNHSMCLCLPFKMEAAIINKTLSKVSTLTPLLDKSGIHHTTIGELARIKEKNSSQYLSCYSPDIDQTLISGTICNP